MSWLWGWVRLPALPLCWPAEGTSNTTPAHQGRPQASGYRLAAAPLLSPSRGLHFSRALQAPFWRWLAPWSRDRFFPRYPPHSCLFYPSSLLWMCWTWSNPLENGYRLTYTTGLAEESEQQQKKSRKKESNRSHVKRISFHLFALLFNVTLHLCLISYARPPSVPLRWNPPPSGGTRAADDALSLSLSLEPLSALPPLYLTQFHTSGPLQSLLKYNHLVYSPPSQTT